MQLRRRIELYLIRARISATRFGRETMNDPNFVRNVREGRKVRAETVERVNAWIDRAYAQARKRR